MVHVMNHMLDGMCGVVRLNMTPLWIPYALHDSKKTCTVVPVMGEGCNTLLLFVWTTGAGYGAANDYFLWQYL